jgi:hypothetical protein
MTPLTNSQLTGTWGTVLLPIRENDSIDFPRLADDGSAAGRAPLPAQGLSGAAIGKLLCSLGGWCDIGLRMRWPYRSIDASTLERLRPIVRAALPEMFPDV